MERGHWMLDLPEKEFKILQEEYYRMKIMDFAKKHNVWCTTCVRIFWKKPEHIKKINRENKPPKVKDEIVDTWTYSKIMEHLQVSEIKAKELLETYALSEILRAKDINSIEHRIKMWR